MADAQLYGLKNCSTCVKAMNWLDQHGVSYRFVDYRQDPVAADMLHLWAAQLGAWEKLVNRASMTWRKLPDDQKNPETAGQWLCLIAAFPALIKRPVTIDGTGQVSVGFSEKIYSERFGKA